MKRLLPILVFLACLLECFGQTPTRSIVLDTAGVALSPTNITLLALTIRSNLTLLNLASTITPPTNYSSLYFVTPDRSLRYKDDSGVEHIVAVLPASPGAARVLSITSGGSLLWSAVDFGQLAFGANNALEIINGATVTNLLNQNTLFLAPQGTTRSALQFFGTNTSDHIQFKIPSSVSSYTNIFPAAQGLTNQAWLNDGAGQLVWKSVAFEGGSITNLTINTLNVTNLSIAGDSITVNGVTYIWPNSPCGTNASLMIIGGTSTNLEIGCLSIDTNQLVINNQTMSIKDGVLTTNLTSALTLTVTGGTAGQLRLLGTNGTDSATLSVLNAFTSWASTLPGAPPNPGDTILFDGVGGSSFGPGGGGDSVWTNDSSTFYLNAYPTSVIFRPNAASASGNPIYRFNSQNAQTATTDLLTAILNAGTNRVRFRGDGGIHVGPTTPVNFSAGLPTLLRYQDTALGEGAAQQIYLLTRDSSAANYFGTADLHIVNAAVNPRVFFELTAQNQDGNFGDVILNAGVTNANYIQIQPFGTIRTKLFPDVSAQGVANENLAYRFDTALDRDATTLMAAFQNHGTNKVTIAGDGTLSVAGDRYSLSDVTTANATVGAHGFLPKLSGNAAQYLDGTGAYTTPSGGAATSEPFVTIGNTAGLSAERALTSGQISVTDGGANSTATIGATTDTPQFTRHSLGIAVSATHLGTYALGSMATDKRALDIHGAWNNGAGTFTGVIFVNMTNTASSTAKFINFQLGASGDQYWVDRTGRTFMGGGLIEAHPSNGLIVSSGLGIGFSSSSSSASAFDTSIRRNGAADSVQLGSDGNPPNAQAFSAADASSGTDIAGAKLTITGGRGTGAGRGGDVVVSTPTTLATGTTLQSQSERWHASSKPRTLTESTATRVLTVSLASGKRCSVKVFATCYATDGTEQQVTTDEVIVSAINKAGVISTSTLVTSNSAQSAGTLGTTWTAVDSTANTVEIKVSAVSSLTQTTLEFLGQAWLNSLDSSTMTFD